jgi:hypothetical protein
MDPSANRPPPRFVPSPAFAHSRPGYVFQLGPQGLGYYLDAPQSPEPDTRTAAAVTHWTCYRDNQQHLYWADEATGDARWTKPPADPPRVLVDPFPQDEIMRNWRVHRAALFGDELYFINLLTEDKSWTRPPGFLGMPAGEPEDHAKGPFVQYLDPLTTRPYFYNPRTKLSTRHPPLSPELLISEDQAFPPVAESAAAARSLPDSAVAAAPSTTSTSESDSDQEEEDAAQLSAFDAMLARRGVTQIARWNNWQAKIQNEPECVALALEKRRARFEAFVRGLVSSSDVDRSVVVQRARDALKAWAATPQGRHALLEGLPMPADLAGAFQVLEEIEKTALLSAAKKSLKKL